MCFCCRQLLLFVWSQYQRSESYNFLMCPLTTEPTCLISCRCVCVCVLVNPTVSHGMFDFMPPSLPSFSHFLWAVVILPQLTPICVCAHTHTEWGRELQKVNDILWSDQGPLLCLMTVCVAPCSTVRLAPNWLGGGGGGLEAASLGPEWTAEDAGVPKRTIPLLNIQQLLSSSVRSWLYQFLVQTAAPQGSGVWSCKAVLGTVTQRSLKIWEELVSVWDRMSGMEWGCKTIYGSLWLLCKHGSDERKENRGGQRSHDSETGGGVRIRKAVMITDQSKPPEAGARQVVYTHMH